MAEPQTYLCRMIATVPVGHRVEMTWFDLPDTGLFGSGGRRMDEDEPMVRDLDTGIVYTVHWHHSGSHQAGYHDTYPDALHPNNRPVARVVGRVLACRVVSATLVGTSWGPQTYLTVQADDA